MRGRFVACTSLLVIGGLFISLSADWRNQVIAPGPLASPHAQLFDGARDVAKCSACHAAADDGPVEWTASMVSGHGERMTQSKLCLECHDKTIPPEAALSAHNLPPDQLLQLTAERLRAGRGALASVVKAALSPGNELECAACHREHRGSQADLTAMDNTACQACHQERYESFATDHPDFGDWPHQRRTRIRFSHASHRAKHFAEKKATFDCRKCHVEDAAGDVQLTLSYEATCASCHDEKIATSVARGIEMFALPTLDVDALREAVHDIGPWPDEASGDFDGRLPPVMKLLLAADPAAAQALATLGGDFDFFDIDPDDPQQLAACATLAAAIRQLILDLGSAGADGLRERLTTALGGNVTSASVAALIAGLSDDTLRGAAAWLPPKADVESRLGQVPRNPPFQFEGPAKRDPLYALNTLQTDFAPGGIWFRDDATLSIRYRPAAHADPVIVSWLEFVARSDLPRQPIAAAVFKELADESAPGLCASCHSVEQAAGRALFINWHSFDRRSELRPSTKFSHGPHLVLPQLADCGACHKVAVAAETGASYTEPDPQHLVTEFKMMPRRNCAECHTATAAGDRCQSCHNYHVSLVPEDSLTLDPATQAIRRGVRTSSGIRPGRR
jgi:predicted CXXCH cytochrome family protein